MMTRAKSGEGKLSCKSAFTLNIFRVKKTGKHIVELGTACGLVKKSDDVRDLIAVVGCADRLCAKIALKDIKRLYNVK